ncbi:BCL2/adenovirus E1B 19 kDa protein-interacting protein 3 [Culicoides brevitarsis]|uniref:BCL2/adenovirus E1B 19 kDa protein-interacting protein 3 n=1 Tax=Culicoides brevitarsis TaxID=469753 RepID=UPI00307B7776
MSNTPPIIVSRSGKGSLADLIGESWIEVRPEATSTIPKSPDRVTPLPFSAGPYSNGEFIRLLGEAQKESNQSSRVVSLCNSRRDSPKGSPKSPPNSPNNELCSEDAFKGIYINYSSKEGDLGSSSGDTGDWVWDWSSRPDQNPPKDWKFEHPKQRDNKPGYSIRLARVGKNSLFSREVIYSLLLTNVISAILGVGIGVWLTRKGYVLTRLAAE